jgi:starch synthase (maltosyl-transferring)
MKARAEHAGAQARSSATEPARSGPRIYNLYPPLVGSVRRWQEHLPRIAGMRFNWVFLNPFHETGASGSLYAVRDYYRLNPLFQDDHGEPADALLRGFLERAGEHKLAVMMDLVINHTARDSPLVAEHPQWYLHNPDGSVRSPGAVDPNDPKKVVVWRDLADIDFEGTSDRGRLLDYWKDVVRHYTRLGFHGFRCDAAYKVPGEVWKEIIHAGRELNPEAQFFAETLGARIEQITQLHSAGFDYFFNSAKWWDFRGNWLLDQYEQFRHIAPSIAFPETHDTERLAAAQGADARRSRLWYLFAAFFSAGVMMPIGYEFGFRKRLHVVNTRPADWEDPAFDLSSFVRAANEMKAATPVLNEEGPQQRITGSPDRLVVLLRRSDHSAERAMALINRDHDKSRHFPLAELQHALAAKREAIREITPSAAGALPDAGVLTVPPLAIRIFHRA